MGVSHSVLTVAIIAKIEWMAHSRWDEVADWVYLDL